MRDFKHVEKGYLENFRVIDRFSRKQDWVTILVMKKNNLMFIKGFVYFNEIFRCNKREINIIYFCP